MTPAERLAALATDHGWTAQVAESDGDAALILRRDGQTLLGVWEGGRWRSGVALRRGDVGTLLAAQMKASVECPAEALEALLDQLGAANRDKRIERELVTREKAQQRRAAKTTAAEAAARGGER